MLQKGHRAISDLSEAIVGLKGNVMKIKHRLILGFTAPALALLAFGVVMKWTELQKTEAENWTTHTYRVLNQLESFLSLAKDLETGQRGYLLTGKRNHLEPFDSALVLVNESLDELESLTSDNQHQQQRIERIRVLLDEKIDELQETISLRRENSFEAALAVVLTDRGKNVMDDLRRVVKEFAEEEHQLLSERNRALAQSTEFTTNVIFIGIFLVILVVIMVARYTINSISGALIEAVSLAQQLSAGVRNSKIRLDIQDETGDLLRALSVMQSSIQKSEQELKEKEEQSRKDLEQLNNTVAGYQELMSKVAGGDLSQQVQVIADDDALGQLGHDINAMISSLGEIARNVRQASQEIVVTLAEVSSTTTAQAASASEQASAVNETSTTLEEIKATSLQTLEKAQQLGESAEQTRKEGEQGQIAVKEAIEGMEVIRDRMEGIATTILELSEQTQQIGEITDVVAGLAQQSKMLALNASIEAAKAGDAGKGFAVVAMEVKELAEQSQQSTTQVQQILQDIRHATDRAVMATEEGSKGASEGMNLVNRNGEVMRELSDIIRETATASQQIVAAVRQEASGINQVSDAMEQINSVTSQLVVAVRQTEQANHDLSTVAQRLDSSSKVYQLTQGG